MARPRFRYSASITTGYDDNTLQTPTKTEDIPEIVVPDVVVEDATPPRTEQQIIFVRRVELINGGPATVVRYIPTVVTVRIPGKPAKVEDVVLQERIPAQERVGSFFTRASGNYEITFASRKTVFTMDLRGNAEYYFSRPNDQTDFNGSLALNYIHRITPRMQFSASMSLAYLTQPDVRIINGPNRAVGDYFSGTSKFDLSYRWTKRFSTVTSLSLNSLYYFEETQQGNNFLDAIIGTEGRYAWSPRLTLLADVRYGQTTYPETPVLDSHTLYLLLGGEYAFSRRINTSLRLGGSMRTFDEIGGTSTTPYLESTISWRFNPTGFLSLNSRFGFEESGSPDAEVLGFRTGLSVLQAFTARLRGSAGVTYIYRTSTFNSIDLNTSEQTFDVNLGLEYAWSKRFSLNASYVFTTSISDVGVNDYYRNRIFFGAEYSF